MLPNTYSAELAKSKRAGSTDLVRLWTAPRGAPLFKMPYHNRSGQLKLATSTLGLFKLGKWAKIASYRC